MKERVKRRFAALSQRNGISAGPSVPKLIMSCDINEGELNLLIR